MKNAFLLLPAFFLLLSSSVYAGSAAWKSAPGSDIWTDSRNWTPATVPNGSSDTATFGVSNVTSVTFQDQNDMEVNSIVFNAGASAFTINEPGYESMTISGAGIVNNSGVIQNFVIGDWGKLSFTNSAAAADSVVFTNTTGRSNPATTAFYDNSSAGSATFYNNSVVGDEWGGRTLFYGTSTASNATIINSPGGHSSAGSALFYESSSAGNALITNSASELDQGGGHEGQTQLTDNATLANATVTNKGSHSLYGGIMFVSNDASAGDATIINEGGTGEGVWSAWTMFWPYGHGGNATLVNYGATVDNSAGGYTDFSYGSKAENATVIAYGGVGLYGGGLVLFDADSDGGTARIELFDNGTMSLNGHQGELTVGSIEGNGLINTYYSDLAVGSNNISTIFAGRIIGPGKLTKLGVGRLVLTNRNAYSGGTIIRDGELVVNNKGGSATGGGSVEVVNGTLAGQGTINGAVNVGHGAAGVAFFLLA
jgi:fibronectin-binding autotransporter adhesin